MVSSSVTRYVIHINFHRKLFHENDLNGTKRKYFDTWYRKNVLAGTKSWSY